MYTLCLWVILGHWLHKRLVCQNDNSVYTNPQPMDITPEDYDLRPLLIKQGALILWGVPYSAGSIVVTFTTSTNSVISTRICVMMKKPAA
jgi:hypothetical protein